MSEVKSAARNRTVVVTKAGAELMTKIPEDGRGNADTFLPVLPPGSVLTVGGGRFVIVRYELSVSLDGLTTLTVVVRP